VIRAFPRRPFGGAASMIGIGIAKQTFLGHPTNACLDSLVFAEFFPKTGKATPAFAGACFWELCLGAALGDRQRLRPPDCGD
jgi:hypothetical protein